MKARMTLEQVAAWLGQPIIGSAAPGTPIARVHSDSRTLQPGDLFVALKGERFDGNSFLAQAQASGAVAALVQGEQAAAQLAQAGLSGVVVADTRQALAQLAQAYRQQFDLPLIAVTGSNGKTTVTQMLASILRAQAGEAALATEGNLNNDIGVPLTVLRLQTQHRLAVVELGMNHPGEIAALAAVAQPTVALVNNAQREHLEFMHTVQAVAEENGSVLTALPASGVAVFPADDAFTPTWQTLAGQRQTLCFADRALAGAQVYPVHARWQGAAWQLQVHTPQGDVETSLHIAGAHNVKNAMAATACALAAGVPLAAIAQGLTQFEPVKGRSRALALQLAGRALTLVDDSYNANPDSVRAAIDVLASLPGPHLLVLGDMGEVGAQGPAFHAEAGAYARERGLEHVMCLGELARHSAQAYGAGQHFADVEALNAAVAQCVPTVASVLVKGSRFMKMERVVQAVQTLSTTESARSAGC
jgi:UDP-N-acetylmuramoyl-tripeptide--D-alanyl-D-alanine ligase